MMITALGMTLGPLCYVLMLESDYWNVVVGAIAAVLLATVGLNIACHATFAEVMRKKAGAR
jgi:nicotinamide riboside transporter PnuC